MAVEDINAYDDDNGNNYNNNNNNVSLALETMEDETEKFSDWESPLCVPQDSLDDIDWFPNFTDEIISLAGFLQTWNDDFTNKKQRSKRGGNRGCSSSDARRKCSHCHVEDTPQWRMGPSGPKTLCNACGVRYKSGRLVPEYRPAASPTFDVTKHSNFHRKIEHRRNSSG